MPREIELKFKVDDFQAVQQALRAAGAEFLYTLLQTDEYFDTGDRVLRGGDIGLRLRTQQAVEAGAAVADCRAQLTYKGPAVVRSRAKIREEAQTRLEDPRVIEAVFAALGLEKSMTVQKRRSSYRLKDVMVELDELPLLGKFIEIEAPDEQTLQAVEKHLGIASEPIRDHYVRMAEQACSKLNRSCRELTFDGCPDCPK